MNTIIELTEAEIDAVAGGVTAVDNSGGMVSFNFSATVSGTNPSISGAVSAVTTATSASLSASLPLTLS